MQVSRVPPTSGAIHEVSSRCARAAVSASAASGVQSMRTNQSSMPIHAAVDEPDDSDHEGRPQPVVAACDGALRDPEHGGDPAERDASVDLQSMDQTAVQRVERDGLRHDIAPMRLIASIAATVQRPREYRTGRWG